MLPPHTPFGRRLRDAIRQKGWSQEEFCNRASVSANTVSSWTTGHNLPRASRLEAIAGLVDVPVMELLTGSRPRVAASPPAAASTRDLPAEQALHQLVSAARKPLSPDLMTALKAAEELLRARGNQS
jgi:transcriptional regulator with XRE-family HTH domain